MDPDRLRIGSFQRVGADVLLRGLRPLITIVARGEGGVFARLGEATLARILASTSGRSGSSARRLHGGKPDLVEQLRFAFRTNFIVERWEDVETN